jgi:hypothetical protein
MLLLAARIGIADCVLQTRCEPIHGGSCLASMPDEVCKTQSAIPLARLYHAN